MEGRKYYCSSIDNTHGGGVFVFPPPSLSYSCPPLPPPPQSQPPLLPLPLNYQRSLPPFRSKSLCFNPASSRKTTVKNNDRKSKQPMISRIEKPKRQLLSDTTNRYEPDPIVLPPLMKGFEKFWSPPPSSLPMPRFSVKPKPSCTTTTGVFIADDGATDNLRRMLRL